MKCCFSPSFITFVLIGLFEFLHFGATQLVFIIFVACIKIYWKSFSVGLKFYLFFIYQFVVYGVLVILLLTI